MDSAEEVLTTFGGKVMPRKMFKPEALLQEDLVRALIARADALQVQIAAFKKAAFDDIDAYMELLAEKYGIKLGGRRGGITIESLDQTLRIQVSIADSITFGPELMVAKQMVDGCITRWSAGANENLRAVVDDAFSVGADNRVRADRILGLRRLNIADEDWLRAMGAIADAVRVEHSRTYIRLYRRPTHKDQFEQITLDLSRL